MLSTCTFIEEEVLSLKVKETVPRVSRREKVVSSESEEGCNTMAAIPSTDTRCSKHATKKNMQKHRYHIS